MKTTLTHLLLMLMIGSNLFSQPRVAVFPSGGYDDSSGDRIATTEAPGSNSVAELRTLGLLPVISFEEHPYNHNMHIAADGDYYYTINGGSASSGQINKFSLTGTLLQTYPIAIDGRGLSYNAADGFLYASLYGGDIVKIIDLNTATYATVFPGIMQNSQASFAISIDGSRFYNFFQGTLLIHDFITGAAIDTVSGLAYGAGNYGGEAAVAVDSNRIYTWNATIKTVYAYDFSGALMLTAALDSGDNGHSLAIVNGYLFVSKDGNYGIGTWYGYNLYGPTGTGTGLGNDVGYTLFPNPTSGMVTMSGDADAIEIYNVLGEKVYQASGPVGTKQTDLTKFPRGIYFVRIRSGIKYYDNKLVLE